MKINKEACIYCKNCGKKNGNEVRFCVECGCPINKNDMIKQKNTRKYSIAGFICSLCGMFTCGISSIVGLILSILGLSESKKNGQKDGFAIAGIILSSLFILIIMFAIVIGIITAEEVEVIDFSTKTKEETKKWCDDNNANCNISEEYSNTIPAGGFIRQSEIAGRMIKSYISIDIIYSKGTKNRQGEIDKKESNVAAEDNTNEQVSPKKTEEEVKNEYKAECQLYGYKDIARQPDAYKGKQAKFRGKVIQVSEGIFDSKKVDLRVNVTEEEYGFWDDTVYVTYKYKEGENRILEDDIINMYGTIDGIKSCTSILGANITIPSFKAKYIEVE